MSEQHRMGREIRWYTIMLMFIVCGLSLMLFQGHFSTIGIGIMIGTLCGLIGFNFIQHMVDTIEYYDNAKAKGTSNYVLRFVIYGLIFALSMSNGVHVMALFAGILCHKAAILLYVFLHRKED